MSRFDRSDFSVVVKLRAPPPKSWRWEIYRAARSSPVQQSTKCFETMVEAQRAGKEALEEYLEKYPAYVENPYNLLLCLVILPSDWVRPIGRL
jgi:hypothetical protein